MSHKFTLGGKKSCQNTQKLFESEGFIFEPNIEKTDFIVYLGGSDIDPKYYATASTAANCKFKGQNLPRDKTEADEITKYKATKKFIGICRGFQFLNILLGKGSMYVDINNHTKKHTVYYKNPINGTIDFQNQAHQYRVNSYHHQMIIPGPKTNVVGWAEEATYRTKANNITIIPRTGISDPEIAWFNGGQGFGVQFHPEWCSESAKLFWKAFHDWHNYYHGVN